MTQDLTVPEEHDINRGMSRFDTQKLGVQIYKAELKERKRRSSHINLINQNCN